MNNFEQRTLIEIVLYILTKTKGLDYYHVFKVLYFAQKIKMSEWGMRLISDDFFALENGPVPTALYDVIKRKKPLKSPKLLSLYQESIELAGDDALNVLLAKRAPDMSFISNADIDALDKAIDKYAFKSFNELKTLSHDNAWNKAWSAAKSEGKRGGTMNILDIAAASTDNKDMLDYIREQEEINAYLV